MNNMFLTSLVAYCDVFISCLDSHSDGTHSLQSIHWWASNATYIAAPMENKLIYILDGLRVRKYSAHFYFGVNYSFKLLFDCRIIWKRAAWRLLRNSSFVFDRRKKVKHVWNNLWLNKQWRAFILGWATRLFLEDYYIFLIDSSMDSTKSVNPTFSMLGLMQRTKKGFEALKVAISAWRESWNTVTITLNYTPAQESNSTSATTAAICLSVPHLLLRRANTGLVFTQSNQGPFNLALCPTVSDWKAPGRL